MRNHFEAGSSDDNIKFELEKLEKMTRQREKMYLYMEDFRMRFLKRISANSKSKKKESISDYHSIYTPPKQIETKDQMVSEILSLQFLMTPRILHLSLKNQQSIPYIFHLSLMPKSITPFSENYLFEWKNINNSKTVGYINISWIKYVHSEAKNRFCIVCYDYESKGNLGDNDNFKFAHFTVPNNNSFNNREDGMSLAIQYIENLNFLSQKFKENTFLIYQHKYLYQ